MVQKAMHFTPEVLLSAPRRSAGVPNGSGTKVLSVVSVYSFESHKKQTGLRMLDVKTGDSLPIIDGKEVGSVAWLDESEFVFLCSETDGSTTLCVSKVPSGFDEAETKHATYVAGTIDAPAGDLKITHTQLYNSIDFAVVFSAPATQDGCLFNPEKAKPTQSTGHLYRSLYVRHWDTYKTKQKNALWYAKLSKCNDGKYQLARPTNAMGESGLECPIPPFGGAENFDICHNSIIFVAKDPNLDPALNTKSKVYYAEVLSWEKGGIARLHEVSMPGFEGASTSPVLSRDGGRAAWLSMKTNGYEADRNQIFMLPDMDREQLHAVDRKDVRWDRSPSSISFTADGESLLAVAEDYGTAKLFMLNVDSTDPSTDPIEPTMLSRTGYVNDVRPLDNGTIFISASSLVDSSLYAIVDPRVQAKNAQASILSEMTNWTNSNSGHGSKIGLNPGQVSSIWTPASNPKVLKEIHSIVVKPNNFDSSKSYPVAYFIHGGPQGSWADSWSTRWNLAVFAEQGYIVIAPNVTGSTSYGQEFTDSIRFNWGGDPYRDIVNCFEWVGKNMPEADNDRAVALGASYGGYMMNWIQGHDLGRNFKALVCHDGIFSTAGMLATEELYFPLYDLGGTSWSDPFTTSERAHKNFGKSPSADNWRRWDPAQHLSNWSTPQLVIHSSKDYRICISDGLAAFNVLQARGVESEFLTFPDENHFVLKPENSLVWHKVVLNWINKHVGLPPYTKENPDGQDFWGGARDGKEEVVEMMSQGKPET